MTTLWGRRAHRPYSNYICVYRTSILYLLSIGGFRSPPSRSVSRTSGLIRDPPTNTFCTCRCRLGRGVHPGAGSGRWARRSLHQGGGRYLGRSVGMRNDDSGCLSLLGHQAPDKLSARPRHPSQRTCPLPVPASSPSLLAATGSSDSHSH